MTTINEAFRMFLNEQEASLKPDAFLDLEDVILLYEEFLEFSAEDSFSERIGNFIMPGTNTRTGVTAIFSVLSISPIRN